MEKTLLELLEERRIDVWCEGNRLRYRSPEGAMDRELAARLREEKHLLMDSLRSKGERTVTTYPLSQGQKALLFLNQLSPGNTAYNVAFGMRIFSAPDISALHNAFQALTDRHGSLRTVFRKDVHGEYVQDVYQYRPVEFTSCDAGGLTDTEVDLLVTQSHRKPFDLENGPLFRVAVFSLTDRESILVISAHHVIADGWSFWIMLDELKSLYSAFHLGGQITLAAPAVIYPEFVSWQKAMLEGPQGEQLWAYWKKQLAGNNPIVFLPTDHSRPLIPNLKGNSVSTMMDRALTARIRKVALTEGATLYALLLAAYQVLLHRYSGQTDFCVGSPVAGRPGAQFQGVVGLFTNPVVLRASIDPSLSFRTYLKLVRQTVAEAIDHQDYPISLLTERLRPKSDATGVPLFNVDYVLQKPQRAGELTGIMQIGEDSRRIDLGGLEIELYPVHQQEGQLDLTLEVVESTDTLLVSMKYSTDLFEPGSIERLLSHFLRLLESVTEDPDQPLSLLSMMTDRDREQLKAWNDTVTDFPGNPSVVEIFERQALETPERIALSFQSKSMTYRELNETANRLASALRKRGVVSNSAVAVCLDRSMSMVVAFLGILKAGGVYLPVNPTHPRDRISFQVSDAGAAHVITRREMADMFEGLAVLAVDEKFEEVSGESSENPQSLPASDDQAYIIFTSGSTGTPKGVAIRHGGLANAYWAWNEVYRLRGNITAHLQMASNTFDVFVEDIVRALCSGARLVIAPGEAIISPKELYALMRAESVDSAEFVPAVIREMMRYLAETGQTLSFMRLIIVGADTWTMHEYRNAKALCGEQTRLFNSYGVTEVTIDNTYLDNPPVTLEDHRKVPIGKPFPNTRIFILDPFGNPVPVGVPGELYIGGPGVGTGYLNRPELTARHFVKLTVEGGVEEQLFRTGDLARFLSDGNIELIGRSDNQVKIRGFRIETGEIEAVLRQHPMVRQAAVQVRERSGGDRYLAAYIVPEDITLPDMALLRDYCKQKLPDYMTPPVIECLDRMPLTSSGKIDYQSLPEPAETGMVSKLSFVAPRTETEQIISRIWQEVLGMRQVGIHDTFFDLGGHSLLATQVVSRMKQALGMEITLRLFFELTTIAGIAMYVDKVKGIKEAMNSTIFSPVGNREEIEL